MLSGGKEELKPQQQLFQTVKMKLMFVLNNVVSVRMN